MYRFEDVNVILSKMCSTPINGATVPCMQTSFLDRWKGRLILAYEAIVLLSSCKLRKADSKIVISELIIKGAQGSIYFMFICTFLKLLLYYITHINYSNIFIFKFHLLPEEGEIKDEGRTLVSLCCLILVSRKNQK